MTSIAVIGLGIMGLPIANLITAGHDVTGYRRPPGAASTSSSPRAATAPPASRML